MGVLRAREAHLAVLKLQKLVGAVKDLDTLDRGGIAVRGEYSPLPNGDIHWKAVHGRCDASKNSALE